MDIKRLIDKMPNTGTDLTKEKNAERVYSYLPIPNDYKLLWADMDRLGGYPSGIAFTESALIVKAPKESFTDKDKRSIGVYQVIPWDYYEPSGYVIKATTRNGKTIYSLYAGKQKITEFENDDLYDFFKKSQKSELVDDFEKVAVFTSIETADLDYIVFNAEKGESMTPTGHGFYAEQAGAKLDQLHGEKSTVVGGDNAKDGPDKLVTPRGSDKGVPVQCKYCKTAGGSVRACFRKNAQTGKYEYRYYHLDGKTPMMVEVPKDQYEQAVQSMRRRIENGQVPGVTDPEAARTIIREGRITYKQARNLAKAGTVESITYDIATGVVSCSAMAGISAISVFAITFWRTKDPKKSANAALETGIQVFGPAFVGRILAAQLARTTVPDLLIPATDSLAKVLNPQIVQSIVNSFRELAGKKSIYGAAAQKSFAKALRTTVLVQIVIFGVTSIPDTYRVISGKISGAQYTKNITASALSLAGAAGGGIAAGKFVAKVPLPNPAVKAVGVGGAVIGGAALGAVARKAGAVFKEDDIIINLRMINGIIGYMCVDYLLSPKETNRLIDLLNESEKAVENLAKELTASDKQGSDVETFLEPYFEQIVADRRKVDEETVMSMYEGMDDLLIEMTREDAEE